MTMLLETGITMPLWTALLLALYLRSMSGTIYLRRCQSTRELGHVQRLLAQRPASSGRK